MLSGSFMKKGGCSQIISRMYQNVTGYTTMINMQFIMAQIHHPSSINYPKNLSSITWSSDWFHFGIERISKMAVSTLIISIDPLAVRNISSQKISKKSRKILRPIRIFGHHIRYNHRIHENLRMRIGKIFTSQNKKWIHPKIEKVFFQFIFDSKNLNKKLFENF